jgi:hypothetical protein
MTEATIKDTLVKSQNIIIRPQSVSHNKLNGYFCSHKPTDVCKPEVQSLLLVLLLDNG